MSYLGTTLSYLDRDGVEGISFEGCRYAAPTECPGKSPEALEDNQVLAERRARLDG